MAVNEKLELLFLNRTQFGYHLTTYYFCKLAAGDLCITHVGFDTGSPKLHAEAVRVKYVQYEGRKLRRYLRLLRAFMQEVRKCNGVIFLEYFPGCSILRCGQRRSRMVVDIRTGSISQNVAVRKLQDRLMRWECCRFENISIISKSLAKRLRLPLDRTHVLPLGAEQMEARPRRYDRLDLLYVGTFDGRRIEDTVVGVDRFLRHRESRIDLTYTIVGNGHNGELQKLRQMVHSKGLDDVVRLPGYIHRTQLQDIFDRCNVGISYVPMSDAYDCQPVTKTLEYIFAGMPVIATATTENKKVVNESNGVLIRDTPEDFCRGLEEMCQRRHQYDPEAIQRSCPECSWHRIVHRNFIPYIEEIHHPDLVGSMPCSYTL